MSYWMMLRRKRLIASSGINIAKLAITYSAEGGMTDEIVTMADGKYRLLTLTKSGILTIPKEVTADVWLCGGGASGASNGGYGGGGGFVSSGSGHVNQSTLATVAAATGASTFPLADSSVTANGASGKNGGSGGGAPGRYSDGGTGAGVTTYPFGDTEYFSGKPHCGGGGGGVFDAGFQSDCKGGAGGSNGSDGKGGGSSGSGQSGGAGGSYGGGKGGSGGSNEEGASTPSGLNGKNATFYGSGGGGGGYWSEVYYSANGTGGVGYQGIIYVRIPLKQTA